MNKILLCLQALILCLLVCQSSCIPLAKSGENVDGTLVAEPMVKRAAFNFGTAQSAGGIQGRKRRFFPGTALNLGTAQSAGGIQGKKKRQLYTGSSFNFGTVLGSGGTQG